MILGRGIKISFVLRVFLQKVENVQVLPWNNIDYLNKDLCCVT